MRSGLYQGNGNGEEDPLVSSPDDVSETIVKGDDRSLLRKLGISFFLFGLINNVLYVVILSAALDLVPSTTPKGLILFFNIFPSLLAKAFWPYVSRGTVRYGKRIFANLVMGVGGIAIVALFESVYARLFGIGVASFASGLGELTFLQLSTTYSPPEVGGRSVGYFASGTGAAGLVGAFLWWEVRSLGVRTGVGISAILPFVTPLTYLFLLPHSSSFSSGSIFASAAYAPIPTIIINDDEHQEEFQDVGAPEVLGSVVGKNALSAQDKWTLVRPLFLKFMLPLFCVYTLEYTINQGIAPTLLYPVPTPEAHPIVSKIIHSIRDYYPLWQLVYQSAVFLSRSSISLGIPAFPSRFLPMPAVIQLAVLVILTFESATGLFESGSGVVNPDTERWEGASVAIVFVLVTIEGICGGLAYVNMFYHINQMPARDGTDAELAKQEREFQIGSVGFADSLGILCASLIAMPTELELCKAQYVPTAILICIRSVMSFYQSSKNVKLDHDNKTLRAECKDFDGKYQPSSLDLSQYLGINYGYFVWHGSNYMDNARNVRLDGSTLYAELKSSEHTWNAASIDLNAVIGNDNGRLVNAEIGGNR